MMAKNTTEEELPATEAPNASPALTQEEMEAIAEGSHALQETLDQDPQLMAEIETVIREYAHRGITADTARAVTEALRFYLEQFAFNHLWLLLLRSSDVDYVEQVQAQSTPETWTWLRRLMALYGEDMREADSTAGAKVDAWKSLNRRAFYDAVAGAYGITLEIVKYSGETVSLIETPFSTLFLANGILDTLVAVPVQAPSDLISQDTVARFAELAVDLVALYAPELLKDLAKKAREAAAEARRVAA